MINDEILSRLKENYPFLQNLSEGEIDTLKNFSILKVIPAGEMVFLEGDSCSFFSLIISGKVRVYKTGVTGREITLYRFGNGESCILTASCILSNNSFPAAAVVEEEVNAVLVPSELLREFVKGHDLWRKYFFDILANRLAEVMEIIDEVAFKKMDSRLADYLLLNAIDYKLDITHLRIASELGTSREVVTRILKDFEKEKLIETVRGKINIINPLQLKSKIN